MLLSTGPSASPTAGGWLQHFTPLVLVLSLHHYVLQHTHSHVMDSDGLASVRL